jgi:hypothetical protein
MAQSSDLRYVSWLKNRAMKIASLLSVCCILCRAAVAQNEPRGSVLELHSCELYAGGCIVSSEATLGGRYMLRAWTFTGGAFQGTDLTGLSVAALQASSDNLAEPKSSPGQVIVYLPDNAPIRQRAALLAWLKASQSDLVGAHNTQTRVVPIQCSSTDTGYTLRAGDAVSIHTAPLESCRSGACGEALWYTPRTQTSVFTVALDRLSKIHEPLLKLTWDDSGRRSLFLGKFGPGNAGQNLYVSSAELCGASRLF